MPLETDDLFELRRIYKRNPDNPTIASDIGTIRLRHLRVAPPPEAVEHLTTLGRAQACRFRRRKGLAVDRLAHRLEQL